MSAGENSEGPSSTRRKMLTGGMVGLAAVAGATAMGRTPAAEAQTNPSITDWVNVVSEGADNTGKTRADVQIQAAITAAAALSPRGVVYFPAGYYLLQAPLLVPTGVVLIGCHPYGQDYWAEAGSVLLIGSSFAAPSDYPVTPTGNPLAAAIAVFDKASLGSASTAPDQVGIHNLLIEGTNATLGTSSPAGVDGIATFGYVGALHIRSVALTNITGNGIAGYRNSSSNPFPDAWTVADVAIINPGANPSAVTASPAVPPLNGVSYEADGLQLAGNDHSLENIHVQNGGTAGEYGNAFNLQGSNIRCSRLRAEGSGLDGYLWSSLSSGGQWGGITFVNCSTQGNNNNGARITNTSATGKVLNNLADFRGCRFAGDGANGTSGGGDFAAVRVEGSNIVTINDCDVTVRTVTAPNGCPQWALVTASVGSPGGAPMLVQALGGFWASVPGSGSVLWSEQATPGVLSISVHGYVGTTSNPQPTGSTVPVVLQTNPL